jgi:hypothetical protein
VSFDERWNDDEVYRRVRQEAVENGIPTLGQSIETSTPEVVQLIKTVIRQTFYNHTKFPRPIFYVKGGLQISLIYSYLRQNHSMIYGEDLNHIRHDR